MRSGSVMPPPREVGGGRGINHRQGRIPNEIIVNCQLSIVNFQLLIVKCFVPLKPYFPILMGQSAAR